MSKINFISFTENWKHTRNILREIEYERIRVQIEEEYTLEKDDAIANEYDRPLLDGAMAYIAGDGGWWPFDDNAFKCRYPNADGYHDGPVDNDAYRRDLIKAAQMIVAEIERHDRAVAKDENKS